MRYYLILLAALLAPATQANAQVTVDLRALDALPAIGPVAPAPHPPVVKRHPPAEAVRKSAPRPAASAVKPEQPQATVAATASPAVPPPAAKPPAATPAGSATAAAAPPPLPTMDAAPPAVAQIKPIQPAASRSTAVSPRSSQPQGLATEATASRTALRISFARGDANLSPKRADALKQLVASAGADVTYNVVAYATGATGDPSVARRLSLSRALAVRNVLMADGVDASRIYVRAMGSGVPSGPADRVDVTLLGGNDSAR